MIGSAIWIARVEGGGGWTAEVPAHGCLGGRDRGSILSPSLDSTEHMCFERECLKVCISPVFFLHTDALHTSRCPMSALRVSGLIQTFELPLSTFHPIEHHQPPCGLSRGHPGHRRCTCSSSSGHTAHSSRYGHPQRHRTAQLEDNMRLGCSTRPSCAAPAISSISAHSPRQVPAAGSLAACQVGSCSSSLRCAACANATASNHAL